MNIKLFLVAAQAVMLGLMLGLQPASPTSQHSASPAAPRITTAVSGWRWPLPAQPSILKDFDRPEQRWLAGHRGIDLAAGEGESLVAPHRGRVTFASTVVDRPVIVIDHGYGFVSSLEPATAEVDVGSWVEAGARLGEVASGAHCSQRCVHWGVRLDGEYVNPALLIEDLRPSILLPLSG